MAQFSTTTTLPQIQAHRDKASQGHLNLQDPLAFEQAIQLNLRNSRELRLEELPALDREPARELWDSLSTEPAQAQLQAAEHKRVRARVEALARDSASAKADLVMLQNQITQERADRWNHPIMYAGAAGLLGLSALWLLERRKRVQLQDRELDDWVQSIQPVSLPQGESKPHALPSLPKVVPLDTWHHEQVDPLVHPTIQEELDESGVVNLYEVEDLPDLADDYATDVPGLSQTKRGSETSSRVSDVTSPVQLSRMEDFTDQVTPLAPPEWALPSTEDDFTGSKSELALTRELIASQETLLDKSRRVLRNIFQRKLERDPVSLSQASTEIASTEAYSTSMPSTLLHPNEVGEVLECGPDREAHEAFEQEQLARQLQAQLREGRGADYDPDRANIELLSQTRLKPQSHETAVEHLLELRTAVSGLSVLGRPEGALVLLSDHIDAHPDTCAWAYLEHMQLCERLDLREEFESMRKRYRVQFNRMAPYWYEPNSNVLGLDGYARAASELCGVWSQGRDAALAMISAWLIGPILGRKIVQLPAYQDLFDLYELLEFRVDSAAVKTNTLGFCGQADIPQQNNDLANEEFVPTVSLLDLDYEFSSDVTLEEKEVQQAERSVTIVKPGNFSVDFNVAAS